MRGWDCGRGESGEEGGSGEEEGGEDCGEEFGAGPGVFGVGLNVAEGEEEGSQRWERGSKEGGRGVEEREEEGEASGWREEESRGWERLGEEGGKRGNGDRDEVKDVPASNVLVYRRHAKSHRVVDEGVHPQSDRSPERNRARLEVGILQTAGRDDEVMFDDLEDDGSDASGFEGGKVEGSTLRLV